MHCSSRHSLHRSNIVLCFITLCMLVNLDCFFVIFQLETVLAGVSCTYWSLVLLELTESFALAMLPRGQSGCSGTVDRVAGLTDAPTE